MGFFERFLTLWVGLCIIAGVLLSKFVPVIPQFLSKFEFYNVSIPIAILIWAMIFPMMLKVDFSAIVHNAKKPKGLFLTVIINWLIKPVSMFLIAYIFFYKIFGNLIDFKLANEYITGAVLLGAAPCTAMVFVWSYLTNGNPAYTLLQVAVNDIIILFAFVPIVKFLLGLNNVFVPYSTLLLSVVLFVVIPLISAVIVRHYVIKKKGNEYFNNVFLKKFSSITIIALLLTLVLIFSFQGDKIIQRPFDILLISVPLIIQTLFIFLLGYFLAYLIRLTHDIASPAALIGASNFFELSVAVAIALFGMDSGATLATVVGVFVEVPVMLFLVNISNKTRKMFSFS